MTKLDIYKKKLESENIVNVDTINKEIEADKLDGNRIEEDEISYIMK